MVNLTSHGEHKIWVDNAIVYIESTGPWNIEYFHQLHLELQILLAPIRSKPYTVYLTVIGDAIPVKEAIDYHISFVKSGLALAIAVDISRCTTKFLTKKVLGDIYQGAKLKHQFFENQTEAQAWLQTIYNAEVA